MMAATVINLKCLLCTAATAESQHRANCSLSGSVDCGVSAVSSARRKPGPYAQGNIQGPRAFGVTTT